MKKLIFALSLFSGVTAFGQNYATGDIELNNTLISVNTQANANLPDFKIRIVNTYGTTLNQVNSCFAAGMNAGDIFIAFEIGRITAKPIGVVMTNWKTHKGHGWGVIAKNMGIKPGSAAFHQLKNNTKSHAGGVKPPKPNGSAKGNPGGHHGNGNPGNGKGKGKK